MQVMEVKLSKTTIEVSNKAKLTLEFEFSTHEDLNAFMASMHTWFESISQKSKNNDKSPTKHLCC